MGKTVIYSGLYTHPEMVYDISWTSRAIARQQYWCHSLDAEYMLMKDMAKWARYYEHPNAWTFGTLIKFRALEHFIQTYNETFVWVDLDIYPTDAAIGRPLPTNNLFYAPLISIDWAREHNAWHMNNKLAWWNPGVSEYYAWSTGMFIMDRETAFHLWDWINREHHINTRQWWDNYYMRQKILSQETPWHYGSDEAIKEEWLNSHDIQFEQMTDKFHSVHQDQNPIFMHYYGQTKQQYPAT